MNIENPIATAQTGKLEFGARARHSRQVNESYITTGMAFGEVIGLFLIGLAIAYYYVHLFLGMSNYYQYYVTPLLLGPALLHAIFRINGLYDIAVIYNASHHTGKLIRSTALAFFVLIVLAMMAQISETYSRLWFISWAVSSVSFVLLWRGLADRILKQLDSFDIPLTRVAIFGDAIAAYRVKTDMIAKRSGVEVVGIFSDNETDAASKNIAGDLNDLIELGKRIDIDRIIIAKEVIDRFEITKLMNALSILPSEVLLYPIFLGERSSLASVQSIADSKLLRIQKTPISDWGLLSKTIMDKLIAVTALVALAPLLAVVAILIKLDSKGPVIFKQKRNGYNQKEIDVLKFRTMTVMECGESFKQAERNDTRITRVGSFLRKTSIDELPQLINVLRGEMSIVGPRPHPVTMNFDFENRFVHYANRHKVKPGITGWAQVNGYRGPTDTPEKIRKRVEHDLEYIENWSFWLDIKIILVTPFFGLFSKNAF